MKHSIVVMASSLAVVALAGIELAPIDASADRNPSPLKVDMKRIGTLRPRSADEIKGSPWTVGCECLDRDSTAFIQKALASGAKKVVLDRQAGPWYTLPLKMPSNIEFVLEPGVELVAKRGAFRDIRVNLLELSSVSNVVLRGGEGSALRMWPVCRAWRKGRCAGLLQGEVLPRAAAALWPRRPQSSWRWRILLPLRREEVAVTCGKGRTSINMKAHRPRFARECK